MKIQKNLSQKQGLFVGEYLVDLNGTQAAIRAGYSEKTANRIASENLSKPVIQKAIQAAIEKRSDKLEITAEKVMMDIERVRKNASSLVQDPSGNLVMVNHNAALKASELQGKHIGMFKDRLQLSWVEKLTDEELEEEFEELAAAVFGDEFQKRALPGGGHNLLSDGIIEADITEL